jgi:hypothetical protein
MEVRKEQGIGLGKNPSFSMTALFRIQSVNFPVQLDVIVPVVQSGQFPEEPEKEQEDLPSQIVSLFI